MEAEGEVGKKSAASTSLVQRQEMRAHTVRRTEKVNFFYLNLLSYWKSKFIFLYMDLKSLKR